MEIVIILVFAALIIGLAIASYYQKRARQDALAKLAARHGWQYRSDNDELLEAQFGAFDCLHKGDCRYAFNVLSGSMSSGTANRRAICGFDYHYETYSTDSKGNRETHHHYFSAMTLSVPWPLKPLLIRPEGFFDKVGEFFGFDDIDFESDEFSRTFFVKSPDRRWAFDVINQATMEFLLAAPRFTIDMLGPTVMAYRSTTFAPEEFEAALAVMSGIVDRLPESVLRELGGATR